MSSVNKVILIGRLGKDPEVRKTQSGKKVASFTLATSESYKDRDGNRQDSTEWHNIVLWGALAEIAERYIKKGSQVCVIGKLTSRSYESGEGQTRYITEIVGRELSMLGKPKTSGTAAPASTPEEQPYNNSVLDSETETDDLPF